MRVLLICLLLTGCAAFDPEPYNIQHRISTITIDIDPMQEALGVAYVAGDKCRIVLQSYPVCLSHEVRHCFEGEWHPKQSATFPGNDDDCWQDGQQQNTR